MLYSSPQFRSRLLSAPLKDGGRPGVLPYCYEQGSYELGPAGTPLDPVLGFLGCC